MAMKSSKYERDDTYRTRFIAANPPKKGKYRCVYCGRRIPKDKMQVDHVIAVNRVKKNWLYRICVPHGINDLENLVSSCAKCNRRKGDKGGLWAIRGHYWKICLPIYTMLRLMVLAAILFLILGLADVGLFRTWLVEVLCWPVTHYGG